MANNSGLNTIRKRDDGGDAGRDRGGNNQPTTQSDVLGSLFMRPHPIARDAR